VLPRGIFLTALLVVALLGSAGTALAQAEVSLQPATDGTLILVGNGWRPGQRLAVTVGHDVYPAMADSAGGFEVRTGQAATGSTEPTLSVRRQTTSTFAFAALSAGPPRDEPHPFAVLFAQSLAMGTALFALSAGGIGVLLVTARTIQSRRRTYK
jgi:hypothetical protein